MERNGSLAEFAPSSELSSAVFGASVGQWLPKPFAVTDAKEGSGAVLVHVDAVQPPDNSEWDAIKDIMAGAAQRERAEGLFAVFMQRLFSTATVEVRNMDLVDRKGL